MKAANQYSWSILSDVNTVICTFLNRHAFKLKVCLEFQIRFHPLLTFSEQVFARPWLLPSCREPFGCP